MDHPENGADPKSTLADPNGFQYGSRPGEPELPPPRDSAPSIEVPTAASWHVHLELRPEELVALHRLGLTKGGLAWREGMDTWQPLRMPSAEVTGTPEPGAMVESGETGPSGMATTHEATPPHEATMPSACANDSTVEQEPLDVDDSDEVTLARDRSNVTVIPTQPPASQRPSARPASEENDNHSYPGRRAGLPATSPLLSAPPRPVVAPISVKPVRTAPSVPPVGLMPPGGGSGLSAVSDFVAPKVAGLSATLPSGAAPLDTFVPPPPPVPAFVPSDASVPHAMTGVTSVPPPTVIETRGPQLTVRSLWLGATALAAMSALVAAIVSGVLTSIRMQAPTADGSSRITAMNGAPEDVSAASGGPRKRAAGDLSPIPLEQLPLAGASAAAPPKPAPERPKPAEPAAPQTASNDDARARRARPATRPPLDTVASRHSVAPAAPAAPNPPAKTPGGPADLREIARAVAQAARAATACGMSPQSGRVALTFAPSGAVRSVQMEEAFAEREVGACVLRAMGRARVTAFNGEPVTVRKTLRW